MLGLAHVDPPRRAHRPRLHRRAHRGLRRAAELLAAYTPEAVEEITGIPAADLEAAAHIYGEADERLLLWGLGVTEHKYGSEVVQLICNLALMTGKVGRRGSALLPLRGQNNVQGSSDMGALPDTYTAYRSVDDEEVARSLRGGVGRPAPAREGLHDPADVRRRGRRRAEGDVHLRRGRRPDRPGHRPRRRRAGEPRVPASARRSSRTRRPSTPTSSCPPPRSSRRRARSPTPSAASSSSSRRSTRPASAKTDFEIITRSRSALGHEMGWTAPRT